MTSHAAGREPVEAAVREAEGQARREQRGEFGVLVILLLPCIVMLVWLAVQLWELVG